MEKKINEMEKIHFAGYKIVRDDRVKKIRMPENAIRLLKEIINSKPVIQAEKTPSEKQPKIIEGKWFICLTCGYKIPKREGQICSEIKCPKCDRSLSER